MIAASSDVVTATPPQGSIPGEIGHPTSPMQSAPPIELDTVDATPPSGAPMRGRPAKGLSHGWKPSFAVLGVLVVIGLVVAGLLWAGLQFGGTDAATSTSVLPDVDDQAATPDASGDPSDTDTDTEPVALAPATIMTVTAYDPDGDGTENDGDAVLSRADGDAATTWKTVCYDDRFMGGKRGVGLVVSFDEPAQDAITVDVAHGPYQVQFFAVDSDGIPETLDAWGSPLGPTAFANDPGTVVSPLPSTPVRHVLVLLNELGRDSGCTDSNPYRGRLGEIDVAR